MRGRNASQLCRNVATLHQFQLKMHSYEPACCRASQQTTSRRRNARARPTKRRAQQRHHRVSTFSASAGPIVSGGIRAATPSSTLYIIAHHATLTENDGDADWSNILRVSLSSSASNDLGSHLSLFPGVCVCARARGLRIMTAKFGVLLLSVHQFAYLTNFVLQCLGFGLSRAFSTRPRLRRNEM